MRIAIVNDMAIAVEAMRRVLLNARGHELAWVARDGAEAVQRCAQDTPDLVLMDLVMPQMDGIEATRRIMASTPCAIVVVTASVNRNSSKVFEAMAAGALDAVSTPTLDQSGARGGPDALLGKIRTISRLLGERGRHPHTPAALPHWALRLHHPSLFVIGASAGGPAALARILSCFDSNFPAAILVAQHLDSQFEATFVRWLDHQTGMSVRLAVKGDLPQAGTVLVAGAEQHLVITSSSHVGYLPSPADALYRPSIDVCFLSAGRFWLGDLAGVLLTGMGRDGAAGLKALRDSGRHTVVQDQSSSAVYGMPKAAIQLDAADEVLPLDEIGPRLASLVAPAGRRRFPH